jgi:hypothetical protein
MSTLARRIQTDRAGLAIDSRIGKRGSEKGDNIPPNSAKTTRSYETAYTHIRHVKYALSLDPYVGAQSLIISVHEISGVVPAETITELLSVIGVDDGGVNPGLAIGGFEAVRAAVKKVGREGWSAGQVLEQVRPLLSCPETLDWRAQLMDNSCTML